MEIIMDLLLMLGGVAVFMHGMKQMSNGMEQSAGAGVRKLFKKISKNRLMDYGVGIGTTAIVQSSSATSIMTIGLANAGIVGVKQGSGIVLGAKVGTTLTAFLFVISGVSKGSFSIGAVFSSIAFVGVIITMATNKENLKKIALFLTGFGMLFLGLEVMEFAIGGKDSILSTEITKLFNYEIMQNPIFLLALGIVFTCIIQSSTAATGIFITFLSTGVIGSIDQSFFLIMGANIGTCMDGIMASFGSNVNGKRIALFHLLSSTIGAVMFSIILVIFRTQIRDIFQKHIERPEFSLVIFNLIYNFIYSAILLIFLNQLVKLVNKCIKDKSAQEQKLNFIDERLLSTPSIAIEQTINEVYAMAVLAGENLDRAYSGLINEDTSQSAKIASDEYRVDYITRELASYIIKISSCSISATAERLIARLHHVIIDIERIGDHAVNLARETNYMKKNSLHFPDATKAEINCVYERLTKMYELCLETFKTRKTDKLMEIAKLQEQIAELTLDSKDIHIKRLNSGEYTVEMSKTLYAVLLSIQRVSDHLVNVAFSTRSDTGSKSETFKILETKRKV